MNSYKMDLHVHTPASKCFMGEKTDEQYLDILRNAVKRKIDIIAITDHNTVDGYVHLQKLREDKEFEKKTLVPFLENAPEIKTKIKEIDEILELYEKVWLIPGVEITLNPGIHILVLTAPRKVNELSQLLDLVGYTEECRGLDNELLSSIDVRDFLNSPLLEDKIVIAPHVDSGKGIYNDLKGSYRADVFKNLNICAITCNSLRTKEKIQNLVKNDPIYRRDKPWLYINASDAHKVEDIGTRVSYIKLEKRRFEFFKEAFQSSLDKISDIENPKVQELISTLCKSQKTICIDDINEDMDEFVKVVCAYLNSNCHSMLIGVSSTLDIKGVIIEPSKMEKMFYEVENMFNVKKGMQLIISAQDLGNGRYVYIILRKATRTNLYYILKTDEAYIYDKKIRKAKICDIERLIKKRILKELSDFQQHNNDVIVQTQENLDALKYPIDRYQMACDIEVKSVYLSSISDVKNDKPSKLISRWNEKNVQVGSPEGNIYFAINQEARLEDAVLRYSCPKVSGVDFVEEEMNEMRKLVSTSIIITEKGGIYIADKGEDDICIDSDGNYLIYDIEEKMRDKVNIYTLLAWLKSSIFIWYIYTRYGAKSIYMPEIYNQAVFPERICLQAESEAEKIVKKILELEKEFLEFVENCEKEVDGKEDNERELIYEKINAAIDEHNLKISELAKQIDDIFLNEFGFSTKQRNILVKDLKAMKIYNYLTIDMTEHY